MEHVSLKQMLKELSDCILKGEEKPKYFLKTKNEDGEYEYVQITQMDLIWGNEVVAFDGSCSSLSTEAKRSHIYKKVEE